MLQAGGGAKPSENQTVVVKYRGTSIDGVEFDATEKIFSNPSDERTENYVTGRFG